MTRSRDVDRTLDRWMDEGPTVVADRVIAAAMTEIHTTPQRGARWATLKEILMTMKPAATFLGLAVVVVLGFSAYQFITAADSDVGDPPAQAITVDDLPAIVLSADEAPEGMGHDTTLGGAGVLLRPIVERSPENVQRATSQPGYVDGLYSEFSGPTSGVLSWAALFETVEDAESAFTLYDEEIRSPDGHAMTNAVDAGLGEEGTYYTGEGDNETQIYLWRQGALVMAAATYGNFDPDALRSIAEGMDARAR